MAVGVRGFLGTTSLILIAGSIVLMFFVILSGVTNSTPLNKTYFLQADTSSVNGARPISQWTYFYICGADNQDCGAAVPDLPIGYAWSTGSGQGAPAALLGGHGKNTTAKYYYYMWRFGWVFYLLALIFDVFAFFTSLLAPCSRLASGFSGAVLAFALFWFTLAATLMTAVFVKARNRFHDNGMSANIGRYAFGFTWGAWAAMFLATCLLFWSLLFGGSRERTARSAGAGGATSSRSFFRRQRSRRSNRGSFIDNDSQRRVKDEYA